VSNQTSISLEELTSDHDIVQVVDEPGQQFAIVAPKDSHRPGFGELGTTSASPWTSFTRKEYNYKLLGIRGLEVYDKMRKSDGTVRGTLRAVKTPVLSGRWFIDPRGDRKKDKKAAKFVEEVLLGDVMTLSWTQVLTEALLMLDFGYYMFEKVWDLAIVDGQPRTILKKLAPRHPMDVKEWKYDSNGGPAGVVMYGSNSNEDYFIPIEKLLVFTFDKEAGNIEGISVLRSAYKHWYFKEQLYKIDAIQKERHGIGIPVIKLPLGFTDADKRLAEELGRNIRTNERAHIVLPPSWEIMMLKLEGNPVDALTSVEHHNAAIRENILVNFIVEGAKEEDLVLFLKATRFIADIVIDSFNSYLIPQLIDYNFTNVEYPKLKVRRIGETADWRTLSFAIRNLIGAGVIIPDEQLEINLRNEMDLPQIDKDSARLIATPQNPYDINDEIQTDHADQRGGSGDSSGDNTHNKDNPAYNRSRRKGSKKGLPRQSLPGNAKSTFGLPSSRAGKDTSGGK
jgi:hypothetical protein